MSPYWGVDFFQFFAVLFRRVFAVLTQGNLSLAPDELQIAVLGAIAIACGAIGPFLVLKRAAMFANSLSHTILLGVAAAYLIASSFWGGELFDLPTLLIGAVVAAAATAFFTEGLTRFFRLQEDASIGLVFTSLFALGIVTVTLFTRDVHLGVEAVIGNADILQAKDLRLALLLAGLNVLIVSVFFKPFQLASFDRSLAETLGIPCGKFHFLLLFLTAATCIGAFRAVGVLLVLAFLVGPYLTARLFWRRLPQLIFGSCAIGVLVSAAGVALARHLLTVYGCALSTGGLVASLFGLVYGISVLVKKLFLLSPKSATLIHK